MLPLFSRRFLMASAYAVTCLMSCATAAQVSTRITCEEHMKRSRDFSARGDDPSGEKVNLQDGPGSFLLRRCLYPSSNWAQGCSQQKSGAPSENMPESQVLEKELGLLISVEP